MAGDLDIVGNAAVDVVPIAPLFHEKLRAMVLPGADKLGNDLGEAIARTMSLKIAAAIPKAVADGAKLARADAVKQGSSTGGAFADSLRAKLTAAFRAMPKLDIGLNDTGVDAQLARLRAKLEDLRNTRIGIDLSVADAEAKISEIDDRLARLGASSPNVRVRVDVATARAALAEIKAEIKAASADPLTIPVRVGQFRESLIAQVEAAQASLPALEITADTAPARQELDRYRAELAAIPIRLRTDANFGDAEALAKIDELKIKLDRLSLSRVDIDVRADAARASAELATIQAEVSALDGERVDLDFGSANAGALELAINLAVLVAIPLVPVLGAGIGGLAAAFTAAGAGAGAFALAAIPAIKGVTAAMAAQTAAKNDDTSATSAQANAGNTAAQQALSMAGAQQALASAERSAASSIRSADEQVATSQRAVATAVTTAADQRKTALAGVKTAEQQLADAQRASTDAEDALVQARATAAQQLKDLDNQLKDGALNSRAAALQVAQTKADLTAAQKNPLSSPLELQAAQLAYDQALQAQVEQKQSYADLQKSAAAQTKAGVDGNDAVKTATEQVAAAQQDLANKTQAVADAQTNVATTAATNAQAISDAQQKEADAYQNAADARASAADSIASAERGIESAQLSASTVTVAATTKADAYQKALAKLSPSARDLFNALAGPQGLKTAFSEWSTSMAPDVLPIFTRGVESAKTSLPGLTPLVLAAADGIGILYDKAAKELKTPFWAGFRRDIQTSAEPAIVGLGIAFGNVFKGMAGIVDAFLPHMDGIASTMDRITGRFAKWGAGLKGSPDFENFLDYVKREGPVVAEFLGNILGAALDVSKALAPVSSAAFSVLNPIVNAIGWLAENEPGVIQLMYSIYLATKLWAVATWLLNGAFAVYDVLMEGAAISTSVFATALASTGISEIILIIVGAVVLLGVALYELFNHVGWFRDLVKAAWKEIEAASVYLWNVALKPVFQAIAIGLHAVGGAAVWLYEKAIKPAFDLIWYVFRLTLTILLTALITPGYLAIKYVLAPVFIWLWTNAVRPAFLGIATVAVWLWQKVLSPVFGWIADRATWLYTHGIKPAGLGIETVFKAVGDAASWLWTHAVDPVFGWIGDKATWLWQKVMKPAFDLIKLGVSHVADSFSVAKDGISTSWGGLEGIAKKPVKFIVDHVYNEGVVPVWNGIAKVTGVGKINKVDLKGWSTGGVLPGYTPGRDPHEFYSPTGGRIALSGGEAIMRPEFTSAVGAGFVDYFNRIASTQGVSGVQNAMGALTGGRRAFSGGGILGGIGDIGSWAWDSAKNLGSLLTDPGKVFDDLLKSLTGPLKSFGSTPYADMLKKLPEAAIKGLKDKAISSLSGLFGGGSGGGDTGAHGASAAASQAMARGMLKAFNWGGDQMAPLVQLWNGESGWRWDALNKSSGAYGIPQSLPANKMAAAGPDWKTNPRTQMTWGMGYIADRYGSPANALSQWMARSPHWYDQGGFLPPGDHAVINNTGKPEPVFTAGQWDTLKANIDARNRPAQVAADVKVFVGDREITDIVRTEITTYDADTAHGIDDGRRYL